jgi:hypothetical protein
MNASRCWRSGAATLGPTWAATFGRHETDVPEMVVVLDRRRRRRAHHHPDDSPQPVVVEEDTRRRRVRALHQRLTRGIEPVADGWNEPAEGLFRLAEVGSDGHVSRRTESSNDRQVAMKLRRRDPRPRGRGGSRSARLPTLATPTRMAADGCPRAPRAIAAASRSAINDEPTAGTRTVDEPTRRFLTNERVDLPTRRRRRAENADGNGVRDGDRRWGVATLRAAARARRPVAGTARRGATSTRAAASP